MFSNHETARRRGRWLGLKSEAALPSERLDSTPWTRATALPRSHGTKEWLRLQRHYYPYLLKKIARYHPSFPCLSIRCQPARNYFEALKSQFRMLCPKALTTSVSRDTTATPTSGQSRTFCIPNTYRGGRWTFQCCCVHEKQSLPHHFALPEISIH